MAPSRTFIKLDNEMPDHPKIEGLSDRSFRDLVRLWCWCSRYLTDGAVPATRFLSITTTRSARELIACGLVERDGDNYRMHDYLDHQQSRDQVQALREFRRDAGSKGGRSKAASKRLASATANGNQTGWQNGARSQIPDNRSQDASNEASMRGARRAPARTLPGDWEPSESHVAYAAEHGIDVTAEAFKFRNHAIANDRRQRDWRAAFSTWLARSREYNPPKPDRHLTNHQRGIPEGW